MSWRYFKVENHKTTLFDFTTCDACGEDCRAPNSVGGMEADVLSYKQSGMIHWIGPLPVELELQPSGLCTCGC